LRLIAGASVSRLCPFIEEACSFHVFEKNNITEQVPLKINKALTQIRALLFLLLAQV
jgi:hypothetical protein